MCVFLPKVLLCKSKCDTSSRLAELGWLHNKVRKYADARSLDRAFGLVGQVCLYLLYSLSSPANTLIQPLNSQQYLFSELLCIASPGVEGILQTSVSLTLSGIQSV